MDVMDARVYLLGNSPGGEGRGRQEGKQGRESHTQN